jgi:hypothetical protein
MKQETKEYGAAKPYQNLEGGELIAHDRCLGNQQRDREQGQKDREKEHAEHTEHALYSFHGVNPLYALILAPFPLFVKVFLGQMSFFYTFCPFSVLSVPGARNVFCEKKL